MRSKELLSIIAFVAAFGISVAVTPRQSRPIAAPYVKSGCAETETARSIMNLLARDIENGRVRDRKVNSFRENDLSPKSASYVNFAAATDEYAKTSASIDDSDLPGDFKTAWRKHMQAWRNHADYLNEISDSSQIRRSSGNGYSRKYSEQIEQISETWYEVLSIAKKYDAYIPAGAY